MSDDTSELAAWGAELCPKGGGLVHINREHLRAMGGASNRERQRADALEAELGPLRRQVALWRANIKAGPAADLFLTQLPDDLDLGDAEAVRQACAEITAAVLDGHRQLAEAGA